MPGRCLLGAHMSIAGGYYKAVEAAAELGMDVVQVFVKNNNQWRAKPISAEEAERFRSALADTGVRHPLAHASYLINLASSDPVLWKRSVEALIQEVQRADLLGIPRVVVHPGAYTSGTESDGMAAVSRALDEVDAATESLATRVLLENTAGQGTCLGWDFAQLADMLNGTRHPERTGICLDTCHAFAAGYPLAPRAALDKTLRQLDETVGLTRVRALHLNDSKKPLGSRVDRHEHIGRGHLGLEPFRLILRSRRLGHLPMYLETPKGEDDETGESWDRINLQTLRRVKSEG